MIGLASLRLPTFASIALSLVLAIFLAEQYRLFRNSSLTILYDESSCLASNNAQFPSSTCNIDDINSTAQGICHHPTTPTKTPAATSLARSDVFGFPVVEVGSSPSEHDLAKPSAKHTFRFDGLLEVNSEGAHPIYDLIESAERKWKAKNDRASKTLREAYSEYLRRYQRKPPKGFEFWWRYVRRHDVRLPDEYDQINRDLEPFWGVDPRVLLGVVREREKMPDSYTVGKDTQNAKIDVLNYALRDERNRKHFTSGGYMLVDLLKEVEQHLPPFRAVFSPHDTPFLLKDHELHRQAVQAGKEGRYLDTSKPFNVKRDGWVSACSPTSPARRHRIPYSSDLPPLSVITALKYNSSNAGSPRPKTFIHDHRLSMDPCLHPSHLLLHGQFLPKGDGPAPEASLIPQFSYSPTTLHTDITTALPLQWLEDLSREDDPEFDLKEDPRLDWRGRNTGIFHGDGIHWELSHRDRLVDWGNVRLRYGEDANGTVIDGVLRSTPGKEWKVGAARSLRGLAKPSWSPSMLDISYANTPINCEEPMCEMLSARYEFRRPQSWKIQGTYKYVMDIDGNGWSSRFKRLITSNRLVFKSTLYPEWFTDRVQPWLHYVPIQLDLSDLLDALYFFRGDPSGYGAHHDLAKKIAEEGRKWSLRHWRKEDLTAYMFRLLLEYVRIMSPERENGGMDYVYREEDEVTVP